MNAGVLLGIQWGFLLHSRVPGDFGAFLGLCGRIWDWGGLGRFGGFERLFGQFPNARPAELHRQICVTLFFHLDQEVFRKISEPSGVFKSPCRGAKAASTFPGFGQNFGLFFVYMAMFLQGEQVFST